MYEIFVAGHSETNNQSINQSLLYRGQIDISCKQSYQTEKEAKEQCYLVSVSVIGF